MKRRSQVVVGATVDKLAVAKELVQIKLAKEKLEDQEKALRTTLIDAMEIGDCIAVDGYKVSRVKTATPVVSVQAASAELEMDDFMQVVKVSITELKKKMGEDKINEIAEKFDVKDYISIRKA